MEFSFDNPARIKRAVLYSVGHPLAFSTATEKSEVRWYRTFFKMPVLPQLLSRIGGLSLTAKSLKKTSREGTFTDVELEVYKAAWDRDHAFDSMIKIYRYIDSKPINIPEDGIPRMPVLFVFGDNDEFISKDVAERTKIYLGNDNVKIYPNLSHWILTEEPEFTAQDIITFLKEPT